MIFRVGLTGGIGCGKSTVATLFAQCGVTIIDSDLISHQLTQAGGAAIADIRSAFGDGYIDAGGALNRERMRQRVFADTVARSQLEAILHPMIRTQMLTQLSAAHSSPYMLLVIPLLLEAPSYQKLVQRTLVVDCTEDIQLARALQRRLDEATARAIMAAQVSRSERLKRADDIINNDGDLDNLLSQVKKLHQRYTAISAGSH